MLKNYIYRKKFHIPESKIPKKIKNQIILITGANSGIGLALTKKFLNLNNTVIATFNHSNENLLKLKNDNLKTSFLMTTIINARIMKRPTC